MTQINSVGTPVAVDDVFDMISFSPDQADAVDAFPAFLNSTNKVMSLIGYAGTGKTTITKVLIDIALEHRFDVALTALTHDAAEVLHKATGRTAGTIHSFLKMSMAQDEYTGDEYLTSAPIDTNKNKPKKPPMVCFVDEASQAGNRIINAAADMAKHADNLKFVFIGDAGQLPPVGEAPSMSVSQKRCPWPTAKLTTIHRQALDNPIIAAATAWRQATPHNMPDMHRFAGPLTQMENGVPGVYIVGARKWGALLTEAGNAAVETGDVNLVRMCCYTNDYGEYVNKNLRKRIYGPAAANHPYIPGEMLKMHSRTLIDIDEDEPYVLRNGVAVTVESSFENKMQACELDGLDSSLFTALKELKGAYLVTPTDKAVPPTIALGNFRHREAVLDIARKEALILRNEWQSQIRKGTNEARPWQMYFSIKNRVSDLRAFFSSTTHKAQGSTIGTVFIDMKDMRVCFDPFTFKSLMYVAMTRAEHQVVLTNV